MRIAMIQMDIAAGEKERNIQHGIDLMERAAGSADVLVLPEMWTTGYDFRHLDEQVTRPGDDLMQRLSSFARYHGITLIPGSLPMSFEDGIYNTAMIIGPDGRQKACYKKVHLFSHLIESRLMKAGSESVCTPIRGVETGLAICYDLRFPELFRTLTHHGATLIILPASWPMERIYHWVILNQARAIENEIFMCSVNAVGMYRGVHLYGNSMFVSPNGTILVHGDEKENIYYADYDGDDVQRQRTDLAVWSDFRENIPVMK
ncbi:MAG TPA: carbon-nitrogen hydrolase [Veillonellaceae bacterium]|jgi:predicted amidohydrolase|nr:carbon-nitrogen hydrolase [Veillonellaceae bacterium]